MAKSNKSGTKTDDMNNTVEDNSEFKCDNEEEFQTKFNFYNSEYLKISERADKVMKEKDAIVDKLKKLHAERKKIVNPNTGSDSSEEINEIRINKEINDKIIKKNLDESEEETEPKRNKDSDDDSDDSTEGTVDSKKKPATKKSKEKKKKVAAPKKPTAKKSKGKK